MPEIRVTDLSHAYRTKDAVSGVSFSVESGTCTVILGPSGAGKTTLLRCIAGLETPEKGRIFFDGRDVTSLSPSQRGIGMIFQSAALFEHTKIKDNIGYGLRKLGYSKQESEKMVYEAAQKLHIETLLDRYPHAVSGGERQRASIARALVRNPQILLLDEPFSSLDARLSQQLQQDVRRLQKETGMTMIMVTHDQSEAAAMAHRLILMHDGRIEADGAPRDLYNHPPTLFAADFLGTSRISRVEKGSELFALLKEMFGFSENAATAALRPSAIILDEQSELKAEVVSSRMDYEMCEARILAADTELLMHSENDLLPGEIVGIRFRKDGLNYYDSSGQSVK